MTLNLRGIISTQTTATFNAAAASGPDFLVVTSENKLRHYNISPTTVQFLASASLGGNPPSGISFISPTTAVISYSGSNRYDLYNINTLATAAITTNATSTERSLCQQIAGNPSTNLALATSSTSGRVTLVGLTCCAPINPSALSGQTARCVLTKSDTNTWLMGTSNGKIHEINSAGVILTTVNVVSTPFVSSPTVVVQSLSYYNGIVAACTDSAQLLIYSWPGGVLKNRLLFASGSALNNSPVLCAAASGTCLVGRNVTPSQQVATVNELYFETGYPNIDSSFFGEANVGIVDLGIEPTAQLYAWQLSNNNQSLQAQILNITSPAKILVQTDLQFPAGNDIAARIIRIRDCNGIGNACVEIDQAITAGGTNLICTSNRNYIEIALNGTGSSPPYTTWDIREFQS